jgi:hypothetical protein
MFVRIPTQLYTISFRSTHDRTCNEPWTIEKLGYEQRNIYSTNATRDNIVDTITITITTSLLSIVTSSSQPYLTTATVMSTFNDLHDPILLHISTFFSAEDLCCRWQCLNRRLYRGIDYETTQVWCNLCVKEWSSYPKYRLTTPEQRLYVETQHPALRRLDTWKQRYVWMKREIQRTHITISELENTGDDHDDHDDDDLRNIVWWFNFTPSAGGRGNETLCRVQFSQGFLFVPLPLFLPMPYRLIVDEADDDGEEDGQRRQYMQILDFPRHHIQGLHESGEWLITNDNVTFVSCSSGIEDDRPTYNERGFQEVDPDVDSDDDDSDDNSNHQEY